jgi:hypothetical protein
MKKKGFLVFLAGIFLLLASGCETVKGAAEGATKDLKNAKQHDKWMQDNLW